MNEKQVKSLREKYPKGTRIKLRYMDDPCPVPSGTKGEITHVDDMGQIHVKWENGSGLALIPEKDKFWILEE